jgi:zinc protease
MKKLFLVSFLSFVTSLGLQAAVADGVVRSKVAGIDLLVDKTNAKDLVILKGTWPAGDAYAPASNPTIATLVAGLLDKGTTKQDKFALAKKLEDLGARIQFGAGDSVDASFSVSCLKEDLPVVINLLAEQLRYPAFSEEELSKYKKQLIAGIKRQSEDPGAQSDRAFVRAAYAPGHVNRLAGFDEWLAGVEAATLAEIKSFHQAHYGTSNMTVVAVGDITTAELAPLLEKEFAGALSFDPNVPVRPAGSLSGPAEVAREQTVFIPGKTSVNVVLGQATHLRYSDPDALALRAGTLILGEGFTGRLMKQVREKEGLTYGIYAGVGNDTFSDGDWQVTATFAPQNVEKGVTSAKGVVQKWLESGVTADELAARKTNMIGKQQVGLATTAGLANSILATVERGLPVTWLDQYPQKVDALTLDQVNGAIRKHLSADKLVLIKAGTIGVNTP